MTRLAKQSEVRLRALGVLFEGGLLAASVVLGSLVVSLMLGAGIIPDPKLHRWALFTVSPLMLAIAAGAYTGAIALAERGFIAPPERPDGACDETGSGTSRDLRAPIPALSPFDRLGPALGVVLSHTGLALAGSMLIALLLAQLGLEVREQGVIQEIVADGPGLRPALVGLGLGAVVLAPVTEEWLFRGLLFRRLWHHGVPITAYLLPAVVFSLIHFNPTGLLTYLWLGVVFAHAYRLTGRLWVAMLVHFGNNAFTFTLLLLGGGAIDTPPAT